MPWKRAAARALLVLVLVCACDGESPSESQPPAADVRGALRVRITVGGGGVDADGFTALVGSTSLPVRDSAVLGELKPGAYPVALSGLANHCSAASDRATPLVLAGDTVTVAFSVRCGGDYIYAEFNASGYKLRYVSPTGQDKVIAGAKLARYSYSWSPDGSRMVFSQEVDGNSDIYVVRPDGTGLVRLTNHPNADVDPAWSHRGDRIAYRSVGGSGSEYWTVGADGSDPRLVFTVKNGSGGKPAWAPGDDAITFSASLTGFVPTTIWSVGLDGSAPTDISRATAWDSDPVWSPDGRSLAFLRGIGGASWALVVAAADGSSQRLLTSSPQGSTPPAWSPDGRRILVLNYVGGTYRIFAANVDGTGVVNLTPQLERAFDPRWTADGRYILFSGPNGGIIGPTIMDADGTRPQLLIDSNGTMTVPESPVPRPHGS